MDSFIEFPGFGWDFPISDTIVQFTIFEHTFSIKWYGLMIAIGFILAVIYALKRANYFDVNADKMIDVVLVSTVAAFIGARLYYIIFSEDPGAYFSEPARIFKVWEGGLAIYGGIIFAFIACIIMCRVRKVNALAMFDIASLGFLIGQGIGRWGNFFNQEAFGGLTNLPWRMSGSRIYNEYIYYQPIYGEELETAGVHPTFLYESLWCALGFILLHFLSKRFYKFKGQLFASYAIWYGLGRFLIESMRTDSLTLGNIKVSMLVSALAFIGGITLLIVLHGRQQYSPANLFAAEVSGGLGELIDDDGDALENTDKNDADDINGEVSENTTEDVVDSDDETDNLPNVEETENSKEEAENSGDIN